MDNQQITNGGLRELALFAGAGGGILGGKLLGWKTVCAVEWEPYPAAVLIARQNDGILPHFPIWDDVRTFDGRPWRGLVDVVSGGFPCQDISAAGKGAGIDGERSGLWAHMARIIREVRPRFAFVENSPMLTSRGLGRVLGDLAEMGYDAKWGVLGAHHVGAPHKRDRIWIRGEFSDTSQLQRNGCDNHAGIGMEKKSLSEFRDYSGQKDVADAGHLRGRDGTEPVKTESATVARCGQMGDSCGEGLQRHDNNPKSSGRVQWQLAESSWWKSEPDVDRVAYGMAVILDIP